MAEPNHGGRVGGGNAIPQKYKIAGYIATWILALVATNPSGNLGTLAWMFPLGLAAIVDLHLANDGGWGVVFACAGVYLVHAYFFFRSKSVLSTSIFYVVLITLLICNIEGCHRMTNTH